MSFDAHTHTHTDFHYKITKTQRFADLIVARNFKLVNLHSGQGNVIDAALNKKDSQIVQPTGAGKSLCYVIPHLSVKKTAVIISPTISLMTI